MCIEVDKGGGWVIVPVGEVYIKISSMFQSCLYQTAFGRRFVSYAGVLYINIQLTLRMNNSCKKDLWR